MKKAKCELLDCKNLSKYTSGLCNSHRMRLWRYGDPYKGTNGVKHGMVNTSEYFIWASAKSRCHNPKDKSYLLYGGRGIKFSKKWLDFQGFIADMGLRPSTEYSLDRKDVDGDYELSNCRWTTRDIQNHNKRAANKLGIKGIDITKHNTYRAMVSRNGTILRKNYKTLQDAIKGYKEMERKLYV